MCGVMQTQGRGYTVSCCVECVCVCRDTDSLSNACSCLQFHGPPPPLHGSVSDLASSDSTAVERASPPHPLGAKKASVRTPVMSELKRMVCSCGWQVVWQSRGVAQCCD